MAIQHQHIPSPTSVFSPTHFPDIYQSRISFHFSLNLEAAGPLQGPAKVLFLLLPLALSESLSETVTVLLSLLTVLSLLGLCLN
jgi:hypothetical protein